MRACTRVAVGMNLIWVHGTACSAGVGPVFVREVERGKETVQLGRVLKLLSELGIESWRELRRLALRLRSPTFSGGIRAFQMLGFAAQPEQFA